MLSNSLKPTEQEVGDNTFLGLPDELQLTVALFLKQSDLRNLALTSKAGNTAAIEQRRSLLERLRNVLSQINAENSDLTIQELKNILSEAVVEDRFDVVKIYLEKIITGSAKEAMRGFLFLSEIKAELLANPSMLLKFTPFIQQLLEKIRQIAPEQINQIFISELTDLFSFLNEISNSQSCVTIKKELYLWWYQTKNSQLRAAISSQLGGEFYTVLATSNDLELLKSVVPFMQVWDVHLLTKAFLEHAINQYTINSLPVNSEIAEYLYINDLKHGQLKDPALIGVLAKYLPPKQDEAKEERFNDDLWESDDDMREFYTPRGSRKNSTTNTPYSSFFQGSGKNSGNNTPYWDAQDYLTPRAVNTTPKRYPNFFAAILHELDRSGSATPNVASPPPEVSEFDGNPNALSRSTPTDLRNILNIVPQYK